MFQPRWDTLASTTPAAVPLPGLLKRIASVSSTVATDHDLLGGGDLQCELRLRGERPAPETSARKVTLATLPSPSAMGISSSCAAIS